MLLNLPRRVTISVIVEKRKNNNNEEDDSREQAVMVSVKDTGLGIDPEIMPKLFTKFSTKSLTGTGLGLYVSKNIIESHGGKMLAQNNPDGKGAVFRFILPEE
jgi:two-component system, OmpR family, sensor histidine kinase VicK